VAALQRTTGVGAIFTRASDKESFDGGVPGTLSFDAIHWDHVRSADILFSPDWTDDINAYGMRGTTASGGVAGHGSLSPWDVHNTAIAVGPDLRSGVTLDVPSANVDFAPTFLTLLDIEAPSSMQGRPLVEAFAAGFLPPRDHADDYAHCNHPRRQLCCHDHVLDRRSERTRVPLCGPGEQSARGKAVIEPRRETGMPSCPTCTRLDALMRTPKAAAAMAHDGVVPESLAILVEA